MISTDLIFVLLGLSKIDSKEKLKKGQKIRAWYQVLKESSPPETAISKFDIL
ncbi:DUF3221 domain-containing protein [Bacillus nakamurai]|uniref:DUF3221 domain-containing protein n=1 Tax=Bacillus nakamurai TaxID=1793963 RepID=UPI0020C59DC6|nr:DUF3221 domain-containing protein [Bacillus nakamurai]MCP6684171.1 YobA family protein [Bacillus nakamurai]